MTYVCVQEVEQWKAAFVKPRKFLSAYFGLLAPAVGAALAYPAHSDLTPSQIGLSGLLFNLGMNLAWACAVSIIALSIFCWGRIWEMVQISPRQWVVRYSGRWPWLDKMPQYSARAALALLLITTLLQPIGLTVAYSGILVANWPEMEAALRCDAALKIGQIHAADQCPR